jgi:hypothetical protein
MLQRAQRQGKYRLALGLITFNKLARVGRLLVQVRKLVAESMRHLIENALSTRSFGTLSSRSAAGAYFAGKARICWRKIVATNSAWRCTPSTIKASWRAFANNNSPCIRRTRIPIPRSKAKSMAGWAFPFTFALLAPDFGILRYSLLNKGLLVVIYERNFGLLRQRKGGKSFYRT